MVASEDVKLEQHFGFQKTEIERGELRTAKTKKKNRVNIARRFLPTGIA